MVKFYDPSQPEQFSKVPKLCDVFPIKTLVLAMQLIALLGQIAVLCLFDLDKLLLFDLDKLLIFFQIVTIVLNAFTVAVFIVENKILIRTHYYLAAIFILVPIAFLVLVSLKFFGCLFSDPDISSWKFIKATGLFVAGIVLLCAYIFYTMMCRRLIKALERQPEDLPELDTTQGLFTFNRDAYDGSERVKLIYPEV